MRATSTPHNIVPIDMNADADDAPQLEPVRKHYHDIARESRSLRYCDMALQILCHQIKTDYTDFFSRHVTKRFPKDSRLSTRESKLLIAMGAYMRPISGSDIASALRADASTISRNLPALIDRGLATQMPCEHDNRSVLSKLTDKGMDQYIQTMRYWNIAIKKAENLTGNVLELEDFRILIDAMHNLKDRAFAFANFKPGRLGTFTQGISRPAHSDRHDVATSFPYKDSYLRFYAELATTDYLDCFMKRAVKPTIKGTGINVRDLRTLMCIDYYNAPMAQAEIAQIMRFDSATVTRAAKQLEEFGFISVETVEDDERLRLLTLTIEGQALAERYRTKCESLVDRVDVHYGLQFSDGDRREMLRNITKIRDRAQMFTRLKKLPKADPVE